MERLPAEAAIARQTADFKAVTLHDQKKKKG
jgi:predicted TIM-barrel enzyme